MRPSMQLVEAIVAAVALLSTVNAQCPNGGRQCYYSLTDANNNAWPGYRVHGEANNNDCWVGYM